MTDRPILFSAPMVKALFAGTKTQTRRQLYLLREADKVIPAKATYAADYPPPLSPTPGEWYQLSPWFGCKSGDRLWVKETWRVQPHWNSVKPSEVHSLDRVYYDADGPRPAWTGKVRVSIHMPKWASRLTLHVTDVRVQRLQDISQEDAEAEGLEVFAASGEKWWGWAGHRDAYNRATVAYANLWAFINGMGSWESNPWVSAITFAVEQANISEVRKP